MRCTQSVHTFSFWCLSDRCLSSLKAWMIVNLKLLPVIECNGQTDSDSKILLFFSAFRCRCCNKCKSSTPTCQYTLKHTHIHKCKVLIWKQLSNNPSRSEASMKCTFGARTCVPVSVGWRWAFVLVCTVCIRVFCRRSINRAHWTRRNPPLRTQCEMDCRAYT